MLKVVAFPLLLAVFMVPAFLTSWLRLDKSFFESAAFLNRRQQPNKSIAIHLSTSVISVYDELYSKSCFKGIQVKFAESANVSDIFHGEIEERALQEVEKTAALTDQFLSRLRSIYAVEAKNHLLSNLPNISSCRFHVCLFL